MLNEKQENFAKAYVLHRNATEAAKAAGYSGKSAANQGYRLLQNQEIMERIEDLEKELETNINVVEEIENQYTFAKANGHTNSAIKALELLSRIRGASDTDNIKIDQEGLKKEIAKNIDVLGEEQFLEILSQTSIFKEVFAEDEEESQKNIDLEEATVAN
tara:strand:- start:101 stop:580 length:480 start_codon:yes stop_codon:yes gene_type:complete